MRSARQQFEVFELGTERLKTKERESAVQWMDRVYYLPEDKGGAKWITRPDQKAIILIHAHPDVREAGQLKSTQDGGSEGVSGVVTQHIKEGVSVGYYLPNGNMSKEHSQSTFSHWITSVSELSSLLVAKDVDAKVPENNWRDRKFIGSKLYSRSAGTSSNLASIPIALAVIDEPDQIDAEIGKDGGVIGILQGRFGSLLNGMLRIVGTTTYKGKSRIEKYIDSCKHIVECFVPCPHCQKFQTLDWGSDKAKHGFKWDIVLDEDGKIDAEATGKTAHYVCAHCSEKFTQGNLYEMMPQCRYETETGYWFDAEDGFGEFKTRTQESIDKGLFFTDAEWVISDAPAQVGIRKCKDGQGLYGRELWTEAARRFLVAVEDAKNGDVTERLQPFYNTYRAISFEHHKKTEVRASELLSRRIDYGCYIPREVEGLTIEIDIQKRFVKYLLVGETNTDLNQSYCIECKIFTGRTSDPNEPLWDQLDNLMVQSYTREDGVELFVQLAIIDCRHSRDNAIKLCSENPTQRIGVFGTSGERAGLATEMFDWDEDKHWRESTVDGETYGAWVVPINPHEASAKTYHKLGIPNGTRGCFWFPKVDPDFNVDFFDEATADQELTNDTNIPKYGKEKGEANEAHDLLKYSVIAKYALQKYGIGVSSVQPSKSAATPQPTTPTFDISDAY